MITLCWPSEVRRNRNLRLDVLIVLLDVFDFMIWVDDFLKAQHSRRQKPRARCVLLEFLFSHPGETAAAPVTINCSTNGDC